MKRSAEILSLDVYRTQRQKGTRQSGVADASSWAVGGSIAWVPVVWMPVFLLTEVKPERS